MSGSAPGELPDTRSSDVQRTSLSLLARIKCNDGAAWEQIVCLYAPLVAHWCRQSHLSEHDAADVFQEVFQAVAANIESFRKERPEDTFRGWLRTITRRKVCDYFRRQGHEPHAVGGTDAQLQMVQFPAESDAEAEDESRIIDSLLTRALEMIRPEFRERSWNAFWLVVVDGKLPTDVAEELGMTAGAVRVAKARVLQRLRQQLGELGN